MSPLEVEAIQTSMNRACIFVGNADQFSCKHDWEATEKAVLAAIEELKKVADVLQDSRLRDS